MKKISVLLFSLLVLGSLSAQSVDSQKTRNDLKRQLALDTEELKQFNEQVKSYETAIESGNQKQIDAIKLMIEQTMLKEIQQGKSRLVQNPNPVKRHQSNKPNDRGRQYHPAQTSRLSEEEKKNREERSKVYLQNKRKKKATAKNEILEHQEALYQDFIALKEAKTTKDQDKSYHSLLVFSRLIEKDLAQTQRKIDAKK